ncbi:hypothetical protein BSL82_00865 [Tardibacter chloracetimidivorans]|uniref:Glycosyltransferase 2-like domain-containing protein n=1 Tax=Tardibacter chloracetimidivorans TaxID=1921510 RepID=A0A1L3ZQX2_9SPHN|nr:glycosyltransferase [Tardibacter chloracetimidivorans]API58028.1 hypothetical protein BSL82_00865 [Tardibacter chloracetimidivorans]
MPGGSPDRITIVIPHLHQWRQLDDCLASLHSQTLPRDRYDIIVVDNGSTDFETGRQNVSRRYPDVRMVSEREIGPGPARNTGVGLAETEMIACVDADCIADSRWVESALNALAAGGAGTIHGGDVQIARQSPGRFTEVEAYEAVFGYRQKLYITKKHFSGTGNLAFWKSDFARIGPFAGITVAEDMDWGRRARAAGMKLSYNPQMLVYHPARKSVAELESKWSRHIAHELEKSRGGKAHVLKWTARSIAVVLSIFPHLGTIALSEKLTGLPSRLKASRVLVRIRLFRAAAMLRQMMSRHSEAQRWNR